MDYQKKTDISYSRSSKEFNLMNMLQLMFCSQSGQASFFILMSVDKKLHALKKGVRLQREKESVRVSAFILEMKVIFAIKRKMDSNVEYLRANREYSWTCQTRQFSDAVCENILHLKPTSEHELDPHCSEQLQIGKGNTSLRSTEVA
ncbi:hypothetical protein Tco_0435267 [Tanacetum coccineum]